MVYKASHRLRQNRNSGSSLFWSYTDEAVRGKIRIAAQTLAVSPWILGLILICAPAARADTESVLYSFCSGADVHIRCGIEIRTAPRSGAVEVAIAALDQAGGRVSAVGAIGLAAERVKNGLSAGRGELEDCAAASTPAYSPVPPS